MNDNDDATKLADGLYDIVTMSSKIADGDAPRQMALLLGALALMALRNGYSAAAMCEKLTRAMATCPEGLR